MSKNVILLMIGICILGVNAEALQYLTISDYGKHYGPECDYPSLPSSETQWADGRDMYLNVVLVNERSYDVTLQSRTTWYRPDGTQQDSDTFTAETLQSGYYGCWWFNMVGYPTCPGNWRCVLEIRERPAGGSFNSWQTAVDTNFNVIDSKPSADNPSPSNSNPGPGDVIQISVNVSNAAQYNWSWSDNGAGGTFNPQSGNTNNDCPGTYQNITNYTVPQSPGQSIKITFTASNSRGSDIENKYISVKNVYTLSTTVNPYGVGTVDPSGGEYLEGTNVPLSATSTNPYYEFDYWSGDASGTNSTTSVTMNTNKAVTANFRLKTYTLTTEVSPPGVGSIILSPDGGSYQAGRNVTAVAQSTSSEYIFDHWEIDLSGSNSTENITMDANKSIRAVFVLKEWQLTTNIDPPEAGSIVPSNGNYTHGTALDLDAQANSGWEFSNWSGDATGTENPFRLTMDSHKSVTAHFTLIEYTLTIEPSTGGYVDLSPSGGVYSYGTTVILTPQHNTGYAFDHWDTDPAYRVPTETSPGSGSYEIVADGDLTVKPVFIVDSTTELSLQPSYQEAAMGNNFTVDVQIANVENLYGHEIDISFDPNVLEVLSVTQGDFLSQGGVDPVYWQPPTIDNVNGRIIDIVNVRITPGVGINGSGILASIEFHEKSESTEDYNTQIDFDVVETKLSDPAANQLPVLTYVSAVIDALYNQGLLGDFDNDNDVDLADFGIFSASWNTSSGDPAWNQDCDMNVPPDSAIDILDLLVFANNWLARIFDEGFESGGFSTFNWQHSGAAYWNVVTDAAYEGTYSAKSGSISDDQQSILEVTTIAETNTFSFSSRISSELDYDFLVFYIDGKKKWEGSGEQNWSDHLFTVTAGNQYTFKWAYEKDASDSSGSDCAWIDSIHFVE